MGTNHSKGQVLCFLWRRKVTVWYGTVADLGKRPQGRDRREGGGGGLASTLFRGQTEGHRAKNIYFQGCPLSWRLGEQAPHFTLRFESGSVVVGISRLVHIIQNSNAERLNNMNMSE